MAVERRGWFGKGTPAGNVIILPGHSLEQCGVVLEKPGIRGQFY
jgi:hypothetical protein